MSRDTQNSDLRKRLQDEASAIEIGIPPTEVDWFLRPNHFVAQSVTDAAEPGGGPLQAIKSPAHADSNNAKSPPSTSTTNATVYNDSSVTGAASSPLARAKTADGNYAGSGSPSYSSDGVSLRRTASNYVDGAKSNRRASVEEKKGGFFKKLLGKRERSSSVSTGRDTHRLSISSATYDKPHATFDHAARSTTQKDPASHVDPKLEHYLEDLHRHNSNTSNPTTSPAFRPVSEPIHEGTPPSPKLDAGGLPIPSHPDAPMLPSAFALEPKYATSPEQHIKPSSQPHQEKGNVFGFSLGRRRTFNDSLSRVTSKDPQSAPTGPPPKAKVEPPISVLKEMKPMKRVAFATTVFVNDPPQQIPSRSPRKGNVEISEDGAIIVHKIDPSDKLKSSAGIVVGGSGHLRLMEHPGSPPPGDAQADSPSGATPEVKEDEGEGGVDPNSKFTKMDVKIDKPMIKRHASSPSMNKPLVTLKLDELYTRCCHLREILPIPATLKQIPKGSTEPLLHLQLRNPRPSMIEVLSFADFIRIAPLMCLSLDGVSLTEDMFRIILSSLVSKKYFEKLSLRNTPINAEGWKMLCWFLSMNRVVKQLDITQCPSLSTNTQKARPSKSNAKVMQCNTNDRSDMDWPLLTATLIARGGIANIVLSGCKIDDLEVFENFMDMALAVSTRNVGLAYNDLTLQHCKIIARWLKNNPDVLGVDLGYNNIGACLKPFIDSTRDSVMTSKLAMLSMNSTNLYDGPEVRELVNTLSKLQNLRYLDLSNNKALFPNFISSLTTYLPLYIKLARLHLDYNDLTPGPIMALAETLPLCKSLTHLSIVGNHLDNASSVSLCHGIKHSKSLFTIEFNDDEVPESMREKIGLYTMRNMERALYGSKHNENFFVQNKGLIKHGGKSITETMAEFLHNKDVDSRKAKEFLKETASVRDRIHESMTELFNLQHKDELNLEGKETLVRLCVIDASLERGMHLIDSRLQNVYSASTHKMVVPAERGNLNQDLHELPVSDAETITTEIKGDDTPSSSLNETTINLKVKDREEGSTLRLSNSASSLKKQLSEEEESDKSDLSHESIAHALLGATDINHVAEIFQTLKKRGVSLRELFSKVPGDESSQLQLAEIGKKLQRFNEEDPEDSDLESIDSADERDDDDDDADNDPKQRLALNEAYDQLIDQFRKIKAENS